MGASLLEGSYVGCSLTVGNPPKQETRTISAYTVAGWAFGGVATVTVGVAFSSAPDAMTRFAIHSGHGGACGVLNKWGLKQTLVSSAPAPGDALGYSLAVADGLAVVGAPGYDAPSSSTGSARPPGTLTDAGAVFVFERVAAGAATGGYDQPRWVLAHLLTQTSNTATDSSSNSRLGHSVAVDHRGGTIVAGAPGHDADAFHTGPGSTGGAGTPSQKANWLGGAGGVAIFRRQDLPRSTLITADFQPTYRAETVPLAAACAACLLGDDPVGLVTLGENAAVQLTRADDPLSNVLTAWAPTLPVGSGRIAGGLPPLTAVRARFWRKDELYVPAAAVAGGVAGRAVSLWGGGWPWWARPTPSRTPPAVGPRPTTGCAAARRTPSPYCASSPWWTLAGRRWRLALWRPCWTPPPSRWRPRLPRPTAPTTSTGS